MTSFRRSFSAFVLFCVAALAPLYATAATTDFRTLLDLDNNAATGCTVDGMSGIDEVLTTTVTSTDTAGTVTAVTKRSCNGGVLGGASPADPGGFPIGLNGASGSFVVETRASYASLFPSAVIPSAMRIGFAIQTGATIQTLEAMPNGSAIIYPPVPVGPRRAVGPGGTHHIIPDGDPHDWGTISPLVTGGASGGSPILKVQTVYAYGDGTDFFFRFDGKTTKDAPVATDDTYNVVQGHTLNIPAPGVLTNDSDPNGGTLTAAQVTTPAHGNLTLNADGGFVYVQDGILVPADTFQYKASNGAIDSNIANVTINVTPNAAPVAHADSYNVVHGGTLTINPPGVLGNDTDAEGDTLHSTIVAQPGHGSVSLSSSGGFTYTHDGSNTTADSFTYRANDGLAVSGPTTVSLTIGPDAAPVAGNDAYSVAEGGTLNVAAPGLFQNDTDVDTPQSQWTATLATPPTHGTVTIGIGGAFVYTHDGSETTSDTFTYTLSDGILSTTGTVNLTITAVNDAPVVTAGGTLAYTENQAPTPLSTTVTVADVDSPSLASATVQITANYANGQDVLAFANTATITGSFDAATGTLTLTGLDTLANYQSALRNVRYANTSENPSTAARTVTWIVNDGTSSSAPSTSSVTVAAVNDAPVVTAGATLAYTENQAPTAIDTTLTISDPDSASLTGATVQITGNYANGQDVLGFANTATITGSFNAANGTLTLTGSDSVANYQAALRSVTYQNTSENPSNLMRTVSWIVNDGAAASNTATSNITVANVNDAPVLTAGGALSYTENGAAAAIDNSITVADADSANLASATVQITGNFQSGADLLGFTNTATITGSYNAATGTLTLTGSDTKANYQAALRSVTYANSSDNPSTSARIITWTASDGTSSSAPVTSTVNVTAVNDAPVLTAGATLAYTENQAPTAIDTTVTITDADSANLVGATVQITGNYAGAEDVLSFTNTAAISGSFNAGTGTLTLTGTATVANYQAALRSVRYNNTSENPSNTARTVSWQVNDGGAVANLSNVATSTITVARVNDAPVLTAGAALSYTENQSATAIDTTIGVTDVDSTTLTGATVQISLNYANGQDVLGFANTATITGSFNAATGTLTLSGTDTLANYQAALRSVTYANTSDNPSTAARTVTWIGNDGSATSTPVTSTINVTAVNDAPVLTAGATLAFTENQGATAIDGTVGITDVDSANLAGATIQITGGYVNGQDVLGFTNTATITGSFNAGTGTLTLTGTETLANYQAALRAVTYDNTSDDPSTSARTVSWQVNDGGAVANLSNVATSTITVAAVNDAPVLTAGANLSYTENQSATAIDTTIGVTDVDSTTLTGATVQISLNYVNGQDVLGFANTATITGSFNAATGTLTLSGTDTLANYQAALRSVTYANTSDNPSTAARTVTWIGNDGSATSTPVTSTIAITAVNDSAVVSAGGTLSYTENQAPTAIDNTVTITDVDSPTLAGATVQITGSYVNGQDVLGFTNTATITGSFNASSGTLTLTGTDSVANYQAALRAVTYANTSDNPSTSARTVSWQVDDGALASNLSNVATSTISVAAVNDAPTVAPSTNLSYTEGQGAVALDTGVIVSDPDSGNLSGATVQITGSYVNGQDVLGFTNTATITGSFNAATGTLILSGTDTVANYQAALRTVTYANTSNAPSVATRTVTWNATDTAAATGAGLTSTIGVTSVNTPPTVTTSNNASYTENAAPVTLESTLAVSDPDSANLTGATVTISNGFVSTEDVLSFATNGTITGSFNPTTGVLTLAGVDTVANYQSVLRTVKYANSSEDPAVSTRTATWVVTDGTDSSAPATTAIDVVKVNDAPTVTAGSAVGYSENASPVTLEPSLTVTDPDSTNLTGATVQITAGYNSAQDVLAATASGGITVSFNSGSGTLTLSGAASLAAYQTVLRSVTYANTSESPSAAQRTVTWIATDGITASAGATTTITVTPINDAPVLAGGGNTKNYQENDPATNINGSLTVSDVDSSNLTGATVTISNGYQSGADILALPSAVGTITGTFSAVTGVLTLTGNDTVANYETALRSVTYRNTSDNPSTAARTIDFQVTDGSASSNVISSTINVTAVNDAPTVATSGGSAAFTEDGSPVAVDSGVTVTDPDSATLTGATVSITGAFAGAEDVLAFTDTASITGSYNAVTGVLTLTGNDTVANYQAALRSVTYSNTSQNPNTAVRTVTFAVTDGALASNNATRLVVVNAVDDAPVITAGGTLNYTEADPASNIDTGITVSDIDNASLSGATAQITAGYAAGQDLLSFANTATITGVFNPVTATLTLTGSDTVANYQAALRSVKYTNTSNAPSSAPRTVTWKVTDGTLNSNNATSTINVTPVNSAPGIVAGNTLVYTENQAPSSASPALVLTDADSAAIQSASVQITGGYVNGEDVLAFANTPNITGSFAAGTGTLTLSGTDTVANYQTALRSVTYQNTSETPSQAARTLTWLATDSEGGSSLTSSPATSTINVVAVNDAPVISAGATLAFTEDDPASVIDNGINITDVDSTTLVGATVAITNNFASAEDVLSFVNTGTITGVYSAVTGVLTLTGTDTIANYITALRSVKYQNTSQNPSPLLRTISWQVNDGGAANNQSNVATSNASVTPVNDAPVLANGSTLNYTENNAATAVNTAITVSDVDSANLVGATVQISAGYVSGQDVLSFTDTPQITGSFSAATGKLTLSGTTSVANYQAALRAVKYANTSEDPTTAPSRTVTFQVDDGGSTNNLSNTVTSTVNVTAVNDPPVATAYSGLPAQAGIPITYPAGKLGGTDVEAGTTVTIDTTPTNLVNIGSITINANGSFTVTPLPSAASGTASFDYRVTDDGRPAPGVAGSFVTVSFAVAGPAIYFVKTAAAGLGNCTLGNECTLTTAVSTIGASTNANIFLEDAGSHTRAGGVTLTSGSSIIGQGVTAASFDALFGIGAPAQGTLASRPSVGQPRPTLSNTPLVLHNSSQARGFNITTNTGDALSASGKTGLTVGETNIISTAGAGTFAVNLSNSSGTFNFTDVTSSGGAGGAVNLLTVTSGSTITFNNVTSGSGPAMVINGSGATNFTFNDVTSTTGQALNLNGTSGSSTGSYTLHAINANGASTGIFIQNSSGTLNVNGTGSTAGSGGVVKNCTNKGADIRSSSNVTLKNMTFQSNATTDGPSALCTDIVSGGNNGPTNCNANISLLNASTITLNNVAATGSAQIGIDGNTVSNLTLTGVTVTGNGGEVGEDGVQLYNVSGTLTVGSGSVFKDNAANQFEVGLSTGTLNANITGSDFSITNFPSACAGVAPSPGNCTANAGLLFHGNASSAATMNATVTGCTFTNNYSYALRWDTANGTTGGTVKFGQAAAGNTFTNNGLGIGISSTGNGNITYEVRDNVLTNNTAVTGSFATSPISTSFAGNATRTGLLDNNTVGVNGGAVASGCFVGGCSGLELTDSGAQGTHLLTVTNNKVFHVSGSGIVVTSSGNGTDTMRVKIQNNQVAQPDGTSVNPGIFVQDGNAAPNGVTMTCLDINGNSVSGLWASGSSHKSAIRILGTHALQWSLTNFSPSTEYAPGNVASTCTTQCTGGVGTDGNVADFLSQQNPATVTLQAASGGSSASQNRTASSAAWTGTSGVCP